MSGSTCVLKLPLKTPDHIDKQLKKRFRLACNLYNTLLGRMIQIYDRLKENDEYKELIAEYTKEEDPTKRKKIGKQIGAMRKEAGLTEYDVKRQMVPLYKVYSNNIGSNAAIHCIASRVWSAMEARLYKQGKKVHFCKVNEWRSISGYSVAGKSGGTEIIFRGDYLEWKGLIIPVIIDKTNVYEQEMLQMRVKYCTICFEPGKTKRNWYVILALEGNPAEKRNPGNNSLVHTIGSGRVGIDIGPQTIAIVSNTEVRLEVLAVGIEDISKELRIIEHKMDRSKRATNPDCFNEDGTFKKGKPLKQFSKRYRALKKRRAYLLHRVAQEREEEHLKMAHEILKLGDEIYVEDMEWEALAKKEKGEDPSNPNKRKKKYGKSIGNRAPEKLLRIIDRILISRGLKGIIKVPTSVCASQYNHMTGEYKKKSLNQRWNHMPDGRKLQRDLYSAFLLQHMNDDLTGFDDVSLKKDYLSFVSLHDIAIERVKNAQTRVSSMGFGASDKHTT